MTPLDKALDLLNDIQCLIDTNPDGEAIRELRIIYTHVETVILRLDAFEACLLSKLKNKKL